MTTGVHTGGNQQRPPILTVVFGGTATVLKLAMNGAEDSQGPISYTFATGGLGTLGIATGGVTAAWQTTLPENLILDSRFQASLQFPAADDTVDSLGEVNWLLEEMPDGWIED